ncbi:MAG TPA: orotidine-5'-phosphate decarboxylase, partial [Burkholderiales bacterium]|nr:orotidine-5'-phosphate decarboxylase [Burkholderiales bacterium]
MTASPPVIVALDFSSAEEAERFASRVSPQLCRLKIGKELFTSAGPELASRLVARGFDLFLDLKYHDIPNTVAQACQAAARLGVWMINVHALGGRGMMQAARAALDAFAKRPLLIAVTVLTSHSQRDLDEVGIIGDPQSAALRLARLSAECGLDGVVCSAQEARGLRQACGERFLLITPGIRTVADAADDQKRVTTPSAAIAAGSSYLVIGRP